MGLTALLWLLLSAPAFAGDLGDTVTAWGEPLAGRPHWAFAGGLTEESDWIAEPFDVVLVGGVGGGSGSTIQVSRSDAAGLWSAWVDARPRRHPAHRFWAKAVFPDARAGRVRLRAGGPSADVEFLAIETFRSDAREERPRSSPRSLPEPPVEPAAPEPELVERAQWGAKPPREPFSPLAPERLTQHHTAGKRTTGLQESLAEMRFLQDFHQAGRGWNDIGYHYLIDGAGRIFRGRPLDAQGAHVLGHNEGNVGISLMGNYHPPYDDAVTPAQREAIRRLGAWLRDRHGIAPATYLGHRDYNPRTACPGELAYALMPEIRRAIESTPAPLPAAIRRLRLERIPRLLEFSATAR